MILGRCAMFELLMLFGVFLGLKIFGDATAKEEKKHEKKPHPLPLVLFVFEFSSKEELQRKITADITRRNDIKVFLLEESK